ncbi:MAG: tail fiber domain-containing protein [Deltaproteobacteria bacterium]|nr:tail fiber domain-containing protein [Deltaproteobacteria bacterium]
MKKLILIYTVVMLMVYAQAYAAGDLIVNGNIKTSISDCDSLDTDASGNIVCGTDDTGTKIYNETRTLPTVVDEYVEIGRFHKPSVGQNLKVNVAISGGFSVSKQYLIATQYNQEGGQWREVLPIVSTGAYSGNDFSLQVQVQSYQVFLQLRRSSGSAAGTANITIESMGGDSVTFTALSGTGTTTEQPVFEGTQLTQVDGKLGIGTTSPTEALDVVGNVTATGNVTADAICLNGDCLTHWNEQVYNETRTLPTVVDEYVEIGRVHKPSAGQNLKVNVVISGGFSVSKQYLIPTQYHQTGGQWREVLPIVSTGAYSGNDFSLQVRVHSYQVFLQLRRSSGSTTGTANITIAYMGDGSVTFTALSGTGTTTEQPVFEGTQLTQVDGKIGIGTTSPTEALDVVGNVTATGDVTADAICLNGDCLTHWNEQVYNETRTLPTVIDEYVEIGKVHKPSAGQNLKVNVVISGGFSVSKQYLIATQYNQEGGQWREVLPIVSTGAYSGNDFSLQVRVQSYQVFLQLRRSSGSTTGTANITIAYMGGDSVTFTALSGTGTTTEQPVFEGTQLTQVDGKIGIGTTSPTEALDVVGNVTATGNVTAAAFVGDGSGLTSISSASLPSDVALKNGTADQDFDSGTLYIDVVNNRVGIGTTTPNHKLQVAGLINFDPANYSTLIGAGAGASLQSDGMKNTAVGRLALYATTSGTDNTAVGIDALRDNTIGNYNTATGSGALRSNTTGGGNTANGLIALVYNTTGSNNTATGASALFNNTIGNNNTANGSSALAHNIDGNNNTAIGKNAISVNKSGNENTASGYYALRSNDSGNNNTATGVNSLYNTKGSNNTAYGHSAGYNNISGTGNVFLGYLAGYNEIKSNKLYIENTSTSTPLIGGDFAADEVYLNGDVGIGTMAPSEKLDVAGTVKATAFIGDGSGLTGLPTGSVFSEGGTFAFYTSGNVGIGTSAPTEKLDVAGTVKATAFVGDGAGLTNLPSNGAFIDGGTFASYTSGNIAIGLATPKDGYQVSIMGTTVAEDLGVDYQRGLSVEVAPDASKWTLTSNHVSGIDTNVVADGKLGNEILETQVGINIKYGAGATASPVSVVQNAYGLKVDADHGGGQIDNSYGIYIGTPVPGGTVTNKWALYQADAATGSYFAGNVGVGVEAPAYNLDVAGDINASGEVRANTIPLTSDIRYKKNVRKLDDALAQIVKLRGVSYNWNVKEFPHKKFDDKQQIGFIAQEVEAVYPELVYTGKDGYKAVDYARLMPAIVEAIKAQQKEIERLKAENVSLKAKNVTMEDRLAEMEMMKLRMAQIEATLAKNGPLATIQGKAVDK